MLLRHHAREICRNIFCGQLSCGQHGAIFSVKWQEFWMCCTDELVKSCSAIDSRGNWSEGVCGLTEGIYAPWNPSHASCGQDEPLHFWSSSEDANDSGLWPARDCPNYYKPNSDCWISGLASCQMFKTAWVWCIRYDVVSLVGPGVLSLGPSSLKTLVGLECAKGMERGWSTPVFSCDQAALWMVQSVCLSVRLSVRPSVCHTFLTMFPSSYHHEIFRSYYQWQKWRPCKRSRSEVKGQGHRGHNPT